MILRVLLIDIEYSYHLSYLKSTRYKQMNLYNCDSSALEMGTTTSFDLHRKDWKAIIRYTLNIFCSFIELLKLYM